VNQGARIGVSGAEVIEAVQGAEVLDSKNRPLVWRIYGGRTRYLQGAVQDYTSNKMEDIRQAIIKALKSPIPPLNLETLLAEHHQLQDRIQKTKDKHEEGEWLKHHEPEVFQQDPFTCSDEQFLSLAIKRSI
jgi:malonate decarboxylase beta subunit